MTESDNQAGLDVLVDQIRKQLATGEVYFRDLSPWLRAELDRRE